MKNPKMLFTIFASMLMMVVCLSSNQVNAKNHSGPKKMKDCCMMKGGKMYCVKDGNKMPLESNMVMKNGVTCMPNGEYMDAVGDKKMMKEGEMMDMNGNVSMPVRVKHTVTTKTHKSAVIKKSAQ